MEKLKNKIIKDIECQIENDFLRSTKDLNFYLKELEEKKRKGKHIVFNFSGELFTSIFVLLSIPILIVMLMLDNDKSNNAIIFSLSCSYFILIYILSFSTINSLIKNNTLFLKNFKSSSDKLKFKIKNIFTSYEDLNKNEKLVFILDQNIPVDIFNLIKEELTESQIIRLFEKSKSKNVTYKVLIELIKELEFNKKSFEIYKNLFLAKG